MSIKDQERWKVLEALGAKREIPTREGEARVRVQGVPPPSARCRLPDGHPGREEQSSPCVKRSDRWQNAHALIPFRAAG